MNTTHRVVEETRSRVFGHNRYVRDFLRLARVENVVLAFFTGLIGAHLAGLGVQGDVVLAALSGALVLSFGNVVNDIVDRDVDAISKPSRPLPSRRVSIGQATIYAVALAFLSFVIAAAVSIVAVLLVLSMLGVAYAYSPHLKPRPLIGNCAYALQCGLLVAFPAVAVGVWPVPITVWLVSGLVVLGVLAIELAKTAEDATADGLVGMRTIAHTVSRHQMRWLVVSCTIAYALLAWRTTDSTNGPTSWLYSLVLAPVIPLAIGAVAARAQHFDVDLGRAVKVSKVFWLACLVALLALVP
jgi:geranylgeranylglycerol-phosphate geranylgeranyltransferase